MTGGREEAIDVTRMDTIERQGEKPHQTLQTRSERKQERMKASEKERKRVMARKGENLLLPVMLNKAPPLLASSFTTHHGRAEVSTAEAVWKVKRVQGLHSFSHALTLLVRGTLIFSSSIPLLSFSLPSCGVTFCTTISLGFFFLPSLMLSLFFSPSSLLLSLSLSSGKSFLLQVRLPLPKTLIQCSSSRNVLSLTVNE